MGTGHRQPPTEPVYEMLWDCIHCGTRKLLGLTHRHCPVCGAQQNAQARYFPTEEEKRPVQDHVYYGADRICAYCSSSQSRNARHCGNCGAPLDQAQDVRLMADVSPFPQATPPGVGNGPRQVSAIVPTTAPGGANASAPSTLATSQPTTKKRAGLVLGIVASLVGIISIGVATALLWKRPVALTVSDHDWKREIEVERFGEVQETKWCDEMPAGASVRQRRSEVRSHDKVRDGEECSTRNIDNGDGTYRQKQECRPKYVETPVYSDRCEYTVHTWSRDRTETASGGLAEPPHWPEVRLSRPGSCEGCERLGARHETYTVRFTDGQTTHGCAVGAQEWAARKQGSKWSGEIRRITGGLDCSSVKPL